MLAKVMSCAIVGLDAQLVEVEVDIVRGQPFFAMVGLPDAAVRESKERVYSALANAGYALPLCRILVNLAPADIKKEGAALDLPIALGILGAQARVAADALDRYSFIGELGLDGTVKPSAGALVMAPVMWRLGVMPHGQSWPRAVMLMVGASAVFPYVVSKGLAYAPASDGGALAPGMLPFWTALAAYALAGEIPGPRRRFGLAMIMAGAMVVSLWQIYSGADEGAWKGHLMFLVGSGFFALYSVIFRQSGLSPLRGMIIGLFWGTLLIIPILLATGNVTFATASLGDVAVMIVLQSFIIGILAMLLFGYAVQILGAAETAAFGALTPILALIGGVAFLGEAVTPIKVVGVALVVVGVFSA